MNITAVIMAGGRGERFWPRSTEAKPKQFLDLFDSGKTLIQQTIARILPIVPADHVFIVTNRRYRDHCLEQASELPSCNILEEPCARNTAPCIGWAAQEIIRRMGDAVQIVLPSDHLIKNENEFRLILQQAIRLACLERLVTLGIAPNHPNTGYGYINFGNAFESGLPDVNARVVLSFTEKPDYDTARRYLAQGSYLWNSGIFIWTCSMILKAIATYQPDLAQGLERIARAEAGRKDVIEREYAAFPALSIDRGVLEHAAGLLTIPSAFGWDDVGSWHALDRLSEADAKRNVIRGNVVAVDAERCIIQGGSKLLAAIGLEDLIVIDAEQALLICKKNETDKIPDLLRRIRDTSLDDFL